MSRKETLADIVMAHSDEIGLIMSMSEGEYKKEKIKNFIWVHVKPELPYDRSTYYMDIFSSVKNTFKKLNKTKA